MDAHAGANLHTPDGPGSAQSNVASACSSASRAEGLDAATAAAVARRVVASSGGDASYVPAETADLRAQGPHPDMSERFAPVAATSQHAASGSSDLQQSQARSARQATGARVSQALMAAAPKATSTPPDPGSSGSRAASSNGTCTQHRQLASASNSVLRTRSASPLPSEAGGALAGSSRAESASAQVDAPGAPFGSVSRVQASEQALLRGAAACQEQVASERGARSRDDGGAFAHSQPTPAQYASHVVRGDTPFPGGRQPAQQVQFAASLPGWPEESYYDYSSAAASHSSYSHASGQYAGGRSSPALRLR